MDREKLVEEFLQNPTGPMVSVKVMQVILPEK